MLESIALDLVTTQLMFATTRIVTQNLSGITSTGTGFFMEFNAPGDKKVPVLVTNRHVVSEQVKGTFLLHGAKKDSTGKKVPLSESQVVTFDTNFAQNWICHPDKTVDLCMMPTAPLFNAAQKDGKDIFVINLPEEIIPSDQILTKLAALEDVVMVGYPIGLFDASNNLPIIRRGSTASHASLDFNGKPEAVVDMACFPGSSGSPILIVNQGSYAHSGGLFIGNRVFLLGVLFAGPQFSAAGELEVVKIPTNESIVTRTMVPTHLGFYVKAKEILTLKKVLFHQANI